MIFKSHPTISIYRINELFFIPIHQQNDIFRIKYPSFSSKATIHIGVASLIINVNYFLRLIDKVMMSKSQPVPSSNSKLVHSSLPLHLSAVIVLNIHVDAFQWVWYIT